MEGRVCGKLGAEEAFEVHMTSCSLTRRMILNEVHSFRGHFTKISVCTFPSLYNAQLDIRCLYGVQPDRSDPFFAISPVAAFVSPL